MREILDLMLEILVICERFFQDVGVSWQMWESWHACSCFQVIYDITVFLSFAPWSLSFSILLDGGLVRGREAQ